MVSLTRSSWRHVVVAAAAFVFLLFVVCMLLLLLLLLLSIVCTFFVVVNVVLDILCRRPNNISHVHDFHILSFQISPHHVKMFEFNNFELIQSSSFRITIAFLWLFDILFGVGSCAFNVLRTGGGKSSWVRQPWVGSLLMAVADFVLLSDFIFCICCGLVRRLYWPALPHQRFFSYRLLQSTFLEGARPRGLQFRKRRLVHPPQKQN